MSELIEFCSGNPLFFAGSVFVLGLIVGSFLNVVIYRLPIMLDREWRSQASEILSRDGAVVEPLSPTASNYTLSHPRSACPACGAPIAAWQNVPVVSWLLLRGKCAVCKTPISMRYPVVELATGVLSGMVALHGGVEPATGCALILTWSLIALAGIDLDHQLLPDSITLPLLWTALFASVVIGHTGLSTIPVGPQAAILGAIVGYLCLWVVFQAYLLITGKEGMGHGDFKLLAALGAWLGWKLLPVVILLAATSGAVLGIAMIVFRGRDKAIPLPFGPYLAAAGWIAMMYGNDLVDGYLRLSGLQR